MDDHLRALVSRVVAARGSKCEWDGYRRFRGILGPEQLALIDDRGPLVAADPGRRAGKTTAFLGRALAAFEERPRAGVVYFAPSDAQGVDIVWDDIRDYNLRYDLGLTEHWSERWWTLGARKIEVLGFNTRRDVERARGRKFDLVWIDEAQLAAAWFAKFVTSAVLPTTLDYRGQVVATGTPSEVADGFFFDAIHSGRWSSDHHWTCANNPFFAGRDPLREARERFSLDEGSATYQREWLGRWMVNPDELVYNIPERAIVSRPGLQWYGNVIGLDFGWVDHDAICAVGIEPLRQWSHVRHIESAGKQNNHQLFARLLQLAERFPGPTVRDANGNASQSGPVVVYDPAGHATKKTIETFRTDAPLIHWVQAEKGEKVQAISWLNSDLDAGTFTVEPDSAIIKEARRLRWSGPRKLASDADHSDLGDAFLYAHRHARGWLRRAPVLVPRLPEDADPFAAHMAKLTAETPERPQGYFAEQLRRLG